MAHRCLVFVFLVACSSSTTITTPDSGSPTDAASDAPRDVAADTGPVENGCTTFVDRTSDSASRKIQWDLAVTSAPEHCMRVRAGQTVTWIDGTAVADFNLHPIVVYVSGGGSGAPGVDTTTGTATFATPGLYGFACGVHPTMRGAILVE